MAVGSSRRLGIGGILLETRTLFFGYQEKAFWVSAEKTPELELQAFSGKVQVVSGCGSLLRQRGHRQRIGNE